MGIKSTEMSILLRFNLNGKSGYKFNFLTGPVLSQNEPIFFDGTEVNLKNLTEDGPRITRHFIES